MYKTIALLTVGLLTTPALAAPIDGTWLVNANSAQLSAKPKMRTLIGGVYRCATCTPAFAIPADGKFHAIKGDPYGTETAVKLIDAKSVAFDYRQKGRPTGSSRGTVAADGKSMTWSSKSISDNGTVTDSEATDVRLAPGPRGSHAISGSWRSGKVVAMDAKALTVSFKDTGNVFHSSTPTGYSFDAPIGGKPVAIQGDSSGSMASIRRVGPTTYMQSDWLKGKLMSVMTMRVANARTLSVVSVDKASGRVTRYTATKQ